MPASGPARFLDQVREKPRLPRQGPSRTLSWRSTHSFVSLLLVGTFVDCIAFRTDSSH